MSTAFDLTLDAVTQRYRGTAAAAVDQVTLQIGAGELVALLGPSGCGKTTLLRIIAGFVQQTAGRVVVGGKPIDALPPHQREVGVVFQNYALFPHMSAADNVAYGLAARGASRDQQRRKGQEMLALVQMSHLAARLPREMSGGQQQRVALARALVFEPEILLLDEPMGALDKKLREEVQLELRQLQRELGVTTVLVTHDQEEALSLSTRLVVLNLGRVQQVDTPIGAYCRPHNRFVAGFIGTANLFEGQLEPGAGGASVVLARGVRVPCTAPSGLVGPVCLVVRPEHLRVLDVGAANGLPASVTEVVYYGQSARIHLQTASGVAVVAIADGLQVLPVPGQAVRLDWAAEHTWVMAA